jgi:hypothetical protein
MIHFLKNIMIIGGPDRSFWSRPIQSGCAQSEGYRGRHHLDLSNRARSSPETALDRPLLHRSRGRKRRLMVASLRYLGTFKIDGAGLLADRLLHVDWLATSRLR